MRSRRSHSRRFENRTSAAPARRRRFLPCVEAVEDRVLLAIFHVTTTADSGPGSLRQAILDANANPGADAIEFAIPGTDPNYDNEFQVWTIQPTSPLPAITETLFIDGYSQRALVSTTEVSDEVQFLRLENVPVGDTFTLSFRGQTTEPIHLNDSAQIVQEFLEGLPTIPPGSVSVTGGPLTVSTLVVRFLGPLGGADQPLLVPSDPAITVGTLTEGGILTDTGETSEVEAVANTLAVGNNAQIRIILDGSNLPDNVAGLTLHSEHSRIRGLAIDGFGVGVHIAGPDARGNLIQGNSIGRYVLYPNPDLDLPFDSILAGTGNAREGVLIESPTNNTVGGTAPEARNTIAGNGLQGVRLAPGAHGNQVLGNLIGVAAQDATIYYIAGNAREGVLVQSSSNAIGGAVDGARNVISGNHLHGVRIVGVEASRNRVQANAIGTDIGGTFIYGQGNPGNRRDGIRIEDAPQTLIGGTSDVERNVIAGNFGAGIRISGASSTGNLIQGNFIGVNADSSFVFPNAQEGVVLHSANNTVGGTEGGAANVISGNLRGVRISGPLATGNRVLGNFIGTDIEGTADFGNALEGVWIVNARDNTVGGTIEAARNIISGNDIGVTIAGLSAINNVVQGNLIGTDVSGTLALNNAREGVLIADAPENLIGGTTSATRNVISANHWGVTITGPTAQRNRVLGNFIGTDITGTHPLGNELDGVLVRDFASNNRIGDLDPGAGNTIAFNVRDGVRIESGTGNAILSNSIFSNGGLGIDLGGDGVSIRPPGPGPNNWQAFPELTFVTFDEVSTTIQGILRSTPSTTFTLQFFANNECDPSDFGEGQFLLGTVQATTDATGVAVFDVVLPEPIQAGQFVTATATSPGGDTSEFSRCAESLVNEIQFSMAHFVVAGTDRLAFITVTRTTGAGTATVTFATSDGTAIAGVNYIATTGVLVFNPGETVQTFVVGILDDGVSETDKTVNLSLSNPTGGATLGTPSTAVLTIQFDPRDRIPPRVVDVRAVPGPHWVERIVLTFSKPLDPTTAQNLVNYGYSVRTAGPDRLLGTHRDTLIGLSAAVYDPATQTVTLIPAGPIPLNVPFLLMINQATDVPGAGVGVSDLMGNLLDGTGDGQPGGVFQAVVVGRPVGVGIARPAPVIQRGLGGMPRPWLQAQPRPQPVSPRPAFGGPHPAAGIGNRPRPILPPSPMPRPIAVAQIPLSEARPEPSPPLAPRHAPFWTRLAFLRSGGPDSVRNGEHPTR